jgi:hypothetical protein
MDLRICVFLKMTFQRNVLLPSSELGKKAMEGMILVHSGFYLGLFLDSED